MGRKSKLDKKTQINLKLPPGLIAWLDRQPESRAKLIETALVQYYQIPDWALVLQDHPVICLTCLDEFTTSGKDRICPDCLYASKHADIAG